MVSVNPQNNQKRKKMRFIPQIYFNKDNYVHKFKYGGKTKTKTRPHIVRYDFNPLTSRGKTLMFNEFVANFRK